MSFRVVIPARYASTRLPGKPLADIAGKPMVVRVVEAAQKSGAKEIIVATDDARVAEAVRAEADIQRRWQVWRWIAVAAGMTTRSSSMYRATNR